MCCSTPFPQIFAKPSTFLTAKLAQPLPVSVGQADIQSLDAGSQVCWCAATNNGDNLERIRAQKREHNSTHSDSIPLSDLTRKLCYFEVGLCRIPGLLSLQTRYIISFQPITEKTTSLRRIRHRD